MSADGDTGEAPRELISEPLEPDPTAFSRDGVPAGAPAWPLRFTWRARVYEIETIERTWKTTNASPYTTGDIYVRRHYADVRTACGAQLRIYADRSGRRGRWMVHSRAR